jgi:hypothetical protein
MDENLDRDAQLLMLVHVTASLWAHVLSQSQSDPIEATRAAGEASLQALDRLYERRLGREPSPGFHPTVQAILHHAEAFWGEVQHRVRQSTGTPHP